MKIRIEKLVALLLAALLVVSSSNLAVHAEEKNDGSLTITRAAAGTAKKIIPAKISIEGSKYVAKGKKITLTAKVLSDGANQSVIWKSSNNAIATVSKKGVVKGIKPGKVKITATSSKNKKVKRTFTIQVMAQPVKSIKITGAVKTLDLAGQKSVSLKAVQSPKKAAGSFTWSSSNMKVATVSSKGVVTAVGVGDVTITGAATDGSKKKAKISIKVIDSTPKPESYTTRIRNHMLEDSAPYDEVLDLNEDGTISSSDYLVAKRIETAYSDPEQKPYSQRIREYMLEDPDSRIYDAQLDINKDGTISSRDYLIAKRVETRSYK